MRKIAIRGIVVVIVIMAALLLMLRNGYVIEISERKLQQELNQRFPYEECILIFCVKFKDPFVQLDETSNRIHFGVQTDLDFTINRRAYSGIAEFSGRLIYEAGETAFYLAEPKVERFDIQGVSKKYTEQAEVLATVLVKDYLNSEPIYSLTKENIRYIARWLVLKDVKASNGILKITLGLGI